MNDSEQEKKARLGLPTKSRARFWAVRIVVLLVIVGGAIAGLIVWRSRVRRDAQPHYQTVPVERGDLRVVVTATGTLKALDTVDVGAEISGRILKINVDFNDTVKTGQVLAELDTEALKAKVEEAQAQVSSGQASIKTAKSTASEAKAKAERTRQLFDKGLASQQELEAATATSERADVSIANEAAQATVANAALKTAKTNLSKAIIRSPIDGVVLDRKVETGQTVNAGTTTPIMFTLAKDLTQMALYVDVDEADVGQVVAGQRATFVVDAYPKKTFSAEVVSVRNLPKAGTTVVTYEAVLSVKNDDRLLRPGLTATAKIVAEERKDALLVPNAALRFSPTQAARPATSSPSIGNLVKGQGAPRQPRTGGGQRGGGAPQGSAQPGGPRPSGSDTLWVFDGELKRVRVVAGMTDGTRTEIESGIEAGTQVVIDVTGSEP
jgi:HlyD family secretion protein